MINIGIDQASIIAQIKNVHDIGDWIIKSNSVISHVESALSLEAIFGCKRESNAPAPYSVGIEFGYHDFYFRIAFHPSNPKTGIMIKFSAHALEYYRVRFKELFAKGIDLNGILQALDAVDAIIDPCTGLLFSDVTYRCSRIDVYIDYIDASRINFIPSRKERKWLSVHKDDLAEIALHFKTELKHDQNMTFLKNN